MKNNIHSKIKRFLESEDGRVSAKAPLALGIATGSVLLAQAMVPSPAQAGYYECVYSNDCDPGESCVYTCSRMRNGYCVGTWSSECI